MRRYSIIVTNEHFHLVSSLCVKDVKFLKNFLHSIYNKFPLVVDINIICTNRVLRTWRTFSTRLLIVWSTQWYTLKETITIIEHRGENNSSTLLYSVYREFPPQKVDLYNWKLSFNQRPFGSRFNDVLGRSFGFSMATLSYSLFDGSFIPALTRPSWDSTSERRDSPFPRNDTMWHESVKWPALGLAGCAILAGGEALAAVWDTAGLVLK